MWEENRGYTSGCANYLYDHTWIRIDAHSVLGVFVWSKLGTNSPLKTLILIRLQFCSLISDDMGPSSIISPLVWQDVLKIKELPLFPHTTKFQLFASRYIIQDTNIWKYSIMPYGLRARKLASRTGLNSRAQLSQLILSTVCLQLWAESWYECIFSSLEL